MDHDHDHGTPSDASSNSQSSHAKAMQMTFYWSKDLTLLFSGWVTTSAAQYVFTLLAVFCFGILHQFLSHRVHRTPSPTPEDVSSPSKEGTPAQRGGRALKVLFKLVSYAAYTSTSFLLMLMVMSFNVGVFIAVVAGVSFGILLFPKKKDKKSLLADSSSSQARV